jgi:hypothetical protein
MRVYEGRRVRTLMPRDQIPTTVAEELPVAPADQQPLLAKQAAAERWDQGRVRAEVRRYTAPFHPWPREHVANLQLIGNSTLSLGELPPASGHAEVVAQNMHSIRHETPVGGIALVRYVPQLVSATEDRVLSATAEGGVEPV